MIHSYSNEAIYKIRKLVSSVEEKVKDGDRCEICNGIVFHTPFCELPQIVDTIERLECGDD